MTTTERTRLLDVNVLVALALDTHVHHQAAHQALARIESWATCPITEAGAMRVLLTPAVTGRQIAASEIISFLAGIRTDRRWRFIVDDIAWAAMTIDTSVLVGRGQVTDLHLVQLAASNDAVLATFDASLPRALAPANRDFVEVLDA